VLGTGGAVDKAKRRKLNRRSAVGDRELRGLKVHDRLIVFAANRQVEGDFVDRGAERRVSGRTRRGGRLTAWRSCLRRALCLRKRWKRQEK
jgi:hypothetical protein